MTGGAKKLRSCERKAWRVLGAITTAIKCQVPVAAGLSSRAVQPLLPTVSNDKDFLDTAAPAVQEELSKIAKTPFPMFSDAMKAVCTIYDMSVRQLTDPYEKETGDSFLRTVDLVFVDSL